MPLAGERKTGCGKTGGELLGEGSGRQPNGPSWKKTLQSSCVGLSIQRMEPEDQKWVVAWPSLNSPAPPRPVRLSTASPEVAGKASRAVKGGGRWGGWGENAFLKLGGGDSYNPQILTLGGARKQC